MNGLKKTTLRLGITAGLTLGAIVGLVGCAETTDDVEGSDDLASESPNGLLGANGLFGANGLVGVNGLVGSNGLFGANGLMGSNGLAGTNGLVGVNGLAETSGLMTTDLGRKTVAYLVRCALASNDTLVKRDQNGTQYTFSGGMGLCPQWKNGGIATDRNCQNMVSACLMAHVNTSGVHVPLWLDSESSKIGWGVSPNYPKQEGTFFGNILMTGSLAGIGMPGVTGPKAYFCEGAGITAGVVAGRLTSGATNVPYTNPYGTNAKCAGNPNVTAGPTSAGMTAPDGFKVACANGYCFQNGEPITVWRNPSYTPSFDPAYRYMLMPGHTTGKAVDVAYAATTNGTPVQQYANWGGDPQKFAILASGSNWKIAMKNNTNKCLGTVGNGTANYTQIEIQDCNGGTSQAWTVTADANTGWFSFKNKAANRCLDVNNNSTADGTRMQLWDCNTQANQKFKVAAGY
jgi:hypothetical protein